MEALKQPILVQKYGGTSVSTPSRMRRVARRILEAESRGYAVVVVVSAMGHTTDKLLSFASKISATPSRRDLDMLLTTGEQTSIAMLSMAVHSLGGRAVPLTGAQCGIITDGNYSRARIHKIHTDRIIRALRGQHIGIVAGFQGAGPDQEITTLGRGGSDTTAAALAAALKASRCEILTDVEGVLTADPRMVPSARKLDAISYSEMLELAASGSRVLHPRCVEICMNYRVPLWVGSSFHQKEGTLVVNDTALERVAVTGVTSEREIAKLALRRVPDRPGIAAHIFEALAAHGINVRLIIQSISEDQHTDVSLIVDWEYFSRARKILEQICPELRAAGVIADKNVAKVSIVGSGISSTPGVAARMFKALAREKINIDLITTSEIRVACVIAEKHIERAVRAVHAEFQLDQLERIPIVSESQGKTEK